MGPEWQIWINSLLGFSSCVLYSWWSSVYVVRFDSFTWCDMSFWNILHYRGPSAVPWGQPCSNVFHSLTCSLMFTLLSPLSKKDLIKSNMLLPNPQTSRLFIVRMAYTVRNWTPYSCWFIGLSQSPFYPQPASTLWVMLAELFCNYAIFCRLSFFDTRLGWSDLLSAY